MTVPETLRAADLHDVAHDAISGLWRLQKEGKLAFIFKGRVFIGMTSNPDGPGKLLFYSPQETLPIPDDAVIEILAATTE